MALMLLPLDEDLTSFFTILSVQVISSYVYLPLLLLLLLLLLLPSFPEFFFFLPIHFLLTSEQITPLSYFF